jgi:hypothetical protein
MTPPSKSPTPRHFWHTIETSLSPSALWGIWTNVSEWHLWDKGLKSASLEGSFRKGATGSLVSLNGAVSRFTITEMSEGNSYTFATDLPLAKLHVKRYFQQNGGTLRFTHEVWFDGLLGRVFAMLLGKNFMKILPLVMEEVRKKAEQDTESEQIR